MDRRRRRYICIYKQRNNRINAEASVLLQSIFVGVILTATSVSITVETLREIGKLKTESGNAILGAAIIDEVLGIIALTIVTSMADTSVSIAIVLLKILGFFVFAIVCGLYFFKLYQMWIVQSKKAMHRHAHSGICVLSVGFILCRGFLWSKQVLREHLLPDFSYHALQLSSLLLQI